MMISKHRLCLGLLLPALLAGCVGEVRDFIGPRASIVTPQLIRYGLNVPQTRCVGDRLGIGLRPKQLRLFSRAAGAARQGFYDPARFTTRDLVWVATTMRDQRVRAALAAALAACDVEVATQAAPPAPAPAPVAAADAAAARAPAWLNLGAAGSGQTIAIDAASLEQESTTRTAWFRMTDPGAGPSLHSYRLRIDCSHRTVTPLAHRLRDAAGAIADYREYAPGEEPSSPVERGTVTEIAFLSLCT